MKMRLDSDAIICKGNNWYDGEISGFAFRIKVWENCWQTPTR